MGVWNGKKKKKEKWKKRGGEMGSCYCRVLLGERRGRMEKKGNKGGRPTQEWGREKLKKRKNQKKEKKRERGGDVGGMRGDRESGWGRWGM